MKRLLFIAVLLLAGQAWGTSRTITSSDLPYTITEDTTTAYDTIFTGGNLTATAGVLTLSSSWAHVPNNCVIYAVGDTITWGTGGTTCNAITFGTSNIYESHHITIVGGVWDHEPTGTPNGCRWMVFTGYSNLVYGVEADVEGSNAKCVYGGASYAPGSYDNEWRNCTFTNRGMAFTSRCNYDAATVHLVNPYWTPITDSGATYHNWFDSCVIADGPHAGFVLVGHETDSTRRHVAWVTACSVQTDARNTTYSSYSGTCYSAANPYGVVLRHVGRGSKVRDNYFSAGTSYGGSRGILIEYGWGTDSLPIEIVNNSGTLHEGPNVEFGTSNDIHWLRIRYNPRVINADSNNFAVIADTLSATTHTGENAHAVRISNAQNSTANVRLENNTIYAGGIGDVQCYAFNFDDVDYDSTIYSVGNTITSSGTIYKIGDYNDRARGIVIISDTVQFSDSVSTQGQYTYYLGELGNDWECVNNTTRDVYYNTPAADNDITFSADADAAKELTLQRTLNIYVRGSLNDLPVVNALVYVDNDYGQHVLEGYTDSGGLVSGIVSYGYYAHPGDDSTWFNYMNVQAEASGYSANNEVFEAGWTAAGGTDTLDLPINGTGEWGGTGIETPYDFRNVYSGNIIFKGNVTVRKEE